MCTSIVTNFDTPIIGWNLDLLDMKWRVTTSEKGVYIEILDATEGWMPIFGANSRGEFVGMPACWPYDNRSDKKGDQINIINLDADLLLQKRTFEDTKKIVETGEVCSVNGVTFQAQLSDSDGNVLQVMPGQGSRYLPKPKYSVMTNFSLYKMDSEYHPWMGFDRYKKANEMLAEMHSDFTVEDMFVLLKAVSQKVCPTVVSMVFDVKNLQVHWCENMQYDDIKTHQL